MTVVVQLKKAASKEDMRRSRLRLDFVATRLSAAVRKLIVRNQFLRYVQAQIIIAAHVRGFFTQERYHKSRNSIISIQAAERGRIARRQHNDLSTWQRACKACVQRLIRGQEQADSNAIRGSMTEDVFVAYDLPSFKHECHGIHDFLGVRRQARSARLSLSLASAPRTAALRLTSPPVHQQDILRSPGAS